MHQAVRELTAEVGRGALTVPLVAARSGVAPSTIHRRWGDLHDLLSDVAVERLRPEKPPADHGDLLADLTAWAEEFLEEMSSSPGRAYLRDALLGDPDGTNAGQCSAYAAEQIGVLLDRAATGGSGCRRPRQCSTPMIYRILPARGPGRPYARRLVTGRIGGQGR